ncbi:MAG: flagellar basal body P-ring formation protein FlgA [Rhodothermaceae bacterium]|nr:flagellar basal body P-ring formation protein FlgA [Rhodothermaceae bacterium]
MIRTSSLLRMVPVFVLATMMGGITSRASSAQSLADPGRAEARVRTAAERLIAERFPEAAARLEPRVLRLAAEVPGEGSLRLELAVSDGLPRGHTRADLYDDSERLGWALLYVAHFDSVLIARHDHARGEPLDDAALETAWLETTRFHGDPALPSALRTTTRPTARRALSAGDALRASDLAWPTAVDTGDAIRVRYARRGFALVLDAQARERGAVGETIRVHARATGATYRVRLTAPGEADWLETL